MPEINNTDKAENLEQSTVLGKMVKMRYVRFLGIRESDESVKERNSNRFF